MTNEVHGALREAIHSLHDCDSRWVRAVPITEKWADLSAWAGTVEVFDLYGHPTASRCYAWEHATDGGKMRLVTVLHVPPVDSPQTAVRAAIVAEHQERDNQS